MSRPIDDKVVKLSLDNQTFLTRLKQTMEAFLGFDKSIEKVGNSTKGIDDASKSITNLKNNVATTDMSPLNSGVQKVQASFSAMSAIAIGALAKIGSEAVSAGSRMMNAFTFKPIQEGFNMYQDKLKSIQVILANTEGKSNLQDVTKSLDELNDYANKTVYSFQDMTTNMGTFTAAGVDLKTSQVAIQGIGNLAASSGSTTQQAATAMYQLSQAIASGKVGLQDWNSVVNAGMGGKKFQTALQENAKAMGKNIDASKSFRDSLADGWVTTDVLMKTLQQFANDPSMLKAATQVKTFRDLMDTVDDEIRSGWSKTFELIVGDFTQAPILWTKVSSVITGGIQKQADARNKMVKEFVQFGGRTDLFNGIASSFKALTDVMGAVKKGFTDVFPPATGKQLADMAKSFAEFAKNLIPTGENLERIHRISRGVFSLFDIGIKVVSAIGKAFMSLIPPSLGGNILEVLAKIGDMITGFDKMIGSADGASQATKRFRDSMEALGGVVGKVSKFIGDSLEAIGAFFGKLYRVAEPSIKKLGSSLASSLGNIDFNKVLAGASVGGLLAMVKKVGSVTDAISNAFKSLGEMFQAPKKISSGFSILKDSLVSFQNAVKATALMEIAFSMLAIATSLTVISKLKFGDIAKGLEVIAVSYAMLTKTLNAISKMNFAGVSAFKAASLVIALSLALFNLALALKVMASVKPEDMGRALLSLAVSMGILVGGLKAISLAGHIPFGAGAQIMLIATSMLILSSSVAILGHLDMPTIGKGLLAMAVLLEEVALYAIMVSKVHISVTSALAVNLIATSLVIMSAAVAILGSLNLETLAKGLGSIAYALLAIAGFSKIVNGGQMVLAGVGVTALALALNLLVPPIMILGNMDFMKLVQGLGALAIILTEVGVALKISSSLTGAASILIVATSITILTPALVALSLIPLAGVASALIMLAGAFTIIGVAAKLIGFTGSMALMAFAFAIGSVGLAVAGIGLALSGFAAALTALASLSAVSITAIISNFKKLIDGSTSIIPSMVKFGVTLVTSFASGMAQAIPSLAESGLKMVVGVLEAVDKHIYKIVTVGMDIVVKFIEGIAKKLPDLIEAGAKMILAFVNGTADSLRKNSKKLVDAMGNIMEAILEVFVDGLAKIVNILFGWIPGVKNMTSGLGKTAKNALRSSFDIENVADEKGDAFTKKVSSKSGASHEAGKSVGSSAKKGVEDGTGDLESIGNLKGDGFGKGLANANQKSHDNGKVLGDLATAGMNETPAAPIGVQKSDEFAGGVGSGTQKAHDAGSSVSGAGKQGALEISYSEAGSKKAGEFKQGAESVAPTVTDSGRQIAGAGKQGALEISYSEAGSQKGGEFGTGVGNAAPVATDGGVRVGSAAKGGMESIATNPTGSQKGIEFGNGVGATGNHSWNAGTGLSKSAKGGMNTGDMHGTGSLKGDEFATGVGSKKGKSKTAGSSLGTSAHSGAGSKKGEMKNTGRNFGQGFVDGVNSMIKWASDAGRALANAAHNAAKVFLRTGSPSRLMRELGVYTGQGFINGIDDTDYGVAQAATALAQQSVEPFYGVGEQISDALDANFNKNPVITPLLDASELNKTNWDFNSTVGAKLAQNGVFPASNDVRFGDINIQVDAKDAPTAAQTANMIDSKFKDNLAGEIRKLRYVH